MAKRIEEVILENLINSEEYARTVLPFLQEDYFLERPDKLIFQSVKRHFDEFNQSPDITSLQIAAEDYNINKNEFDIVVDLIDSLNGRSDKSDWLLQTTEKFCKDKALYNAIMQSIKIMDGSDDRRTKESLPSILQEALAVSFDKSVGHDFLQDADARFDFYHLKEDRIPFDLDMFNVITKGGLPKKTLNVVLAGCVHPETNIKVRIRNGVYFMWIEKEISIGEVEQLMRDGYDVEVTSPDGFVPITEFVDKGVWDEYLLTAAEGIFVSCNENHLFETSDGWKYAKDMIGGAYWVYTDLGYSLSSVIRTGNQIPIVDVVVGHHNHRYYTNGVSSHNTNVGKSLFLCHVAASVIKAGKNALYITAEMAEERIAERIDCNLMDVELDDLYRMSKKVYRSKIDSIESSTHGKLVIKEYATSTAHAGHFRALLDELKLKKNFVPDIILIDYINICASSRMKMSGNVNSYTLVKAIAEELRALAVDYNVPVLSATQTNRAGWQNSEVEMSDTSESAGLPMTVDFLFAMIRTEELDELGQLMIKQLKSRYNNVNFHKKFVVGVDIGRFKLFDVEKSAQVGISDEPIFDKSKFGKEDRKRGGSADFNFD